MQHLADDHLEDYIFAKIPEGLELMMVEDHLFRCGKCFAKFQRTVTYFEVMGVNLKPGAKKPVTELLRNAALELIDDLGLNKHFRLS